MNLFQTQIARLLTVRMIADGCGVDTDTVNRWIRVNGLPATRLPGGWRIDPPLHSQPGSRPSTQTRRRP